MAYLVAVIFAAGAVAQISGSCPVIPTTTVEIQPVYYSEVFPYNTIIDPFRNGTLFTVQHAPTTVAISAYLTSTIYPGTTTSSAAITSSTPFSNTTTAISSQSSSSATTDATSTSSPPTPAPTCIVDTTSGSNQSQIAAAINQWRQDVINVNSFLVNVEAEMYNTDTQRRYAAQQALAIASDEPCQFQTIMNAAAAAGLNSDPAYTCARDDLASVFQTGVLDRLQAIIDDPGQIYFQEDYININRCCRVLSDVEVLFEKANSIYPNAEPQPDDTDAPVPPTCGRVDCSDNVNESMCDAMKRRRQ